MKKSILTAAILAASLSLSSCGTTGAAALGSILSGTTGTTGTTEAGTTDAGSVLGSAGATILNSLLGSILSSTLTEQSIVGTWTYQQPEVRFESENLLAKAGGEVYYYSPNCFLSLSNICYEMFCLFFLVLLSIFYA